MLYRHLTMTFLDEDGDAITTEKSAYYEIQGLLSADSLLMERLKVLMDLATLLGEQLLERVMQM